MPALERGLWWSGVLIAAGLVVDVAASSWVHPLAFVAFLLLACPLVVAGMALFLWTLVAIR
ncbi:MAG TPA: hypothetical protein VJP86_12000 [Vicinamibacterales bacterium]|jgi:hypothetical protein|nr:hypothetical protein [Vicinamibacterales bacterium]